MGRPGGFILKHDGQFHVTALVDGRWDYRGSAGNLQTAESLLAARVAFVRSNPILALSTLIEFPDFLRAYL